MISYLSEWTNLLIDLILIKKSKEINLSLDYLISFFLLYFKKDELKKLLIEKLSYCKEKINEKPDELIFWQSKYVNMTPKWTLKVETIVDNLIKELN